MYPGKNVGETPTYTLSRIENVIRTLTKAVDHLDTAAGRVSSGDLLLAGELRESREECARLEDTSRVVGTRLDSAIDKLRTLLEP